MTTVGDWLELTYGKALKEADRDGGPVAVVGSGGIVGSHSSGLTTGPAIVVGRKGSIGSVTWVDGPAWPIDTAYYATPRRGELDMRWTYWMLQSLGLRTMNKSAAVPGLNRDDVYRLRVNVPGVGEQRRIAAILDQVDAIRTKRRQLLVHLHALTQATFNAMFADFSPNGTTFGDLAEVQGGLQVTTKRASLPMTAPYLRVANVHRGRLELAEIKTLNLTEAEFRRTALQPLDLLFVEGHANPLEIGRVAIWDGSIEGCTHQNHLIRGRLDTSKCDPVFAEYWLNSTAGAAHFRRAGKTTSGLNTISASTVKTAPMLTPPAALQREFAERVSAVNAQRSVVERALAADNELFASLQSRAFRDEL